MTVLREGLLSGRQIVLAGGVSHTICEGLRSLGASLQALELEADVEQEDERAERWARDRAPLHALVYDAGAPFGGGEQAGLRASIDQGWIATRAVATGALIPAHAEQEGESGGEQDASGAEEREPVRDPRTSGKIVLIAPRPDAGPYAEAARAALENMARTLSVEWARYLITVTSIAPGARTTDQQLAELVCFLLSPAGGYFSGCVLSLGTVD